MVATQQRFRQGRTVLVKRNHAAEVSDSCSVISFQRRFRSVGGSDVTTLFKIEQEIGEFLRGDRAIKSFRHQTLS